MKRSVQHLDRNVNRAARAGGGGQRLSMSVRGLLRHSPEQVVADPHAHKLVPGNADFAFSRIASLQRKSALSQADDKYEQEADSVADRVVATPLEPDAPAIQERCAQCASNPAALAGDDDDERCVQRKPDQQTMPLPSRAVDAALSAVNSAGVPLSEPLRAYFEPRFRHEFSNIRIHNDGNAHRASRLVNAQAFTFGQNIVFGQGKFQPDNPAGRWLLAHELTHTIQQGYGRPNQLQTSARGPRGPARASGYEIEDSIRAIELALSIAQPRLEDTSIAEDRLARIRALYGNLQSALPALRAARGTDGTGVVFRFNTDPGANEINPGDAARTVEELFYPFSIDSPTGAVVARPADREEPPLVQRKIVQGVSVSSISTPLIQRLCDPVICLGIIVLAGLLLAGCSRRSSGNIDSARVARARSNFDSNNATNLTGPERGRIHAALTAAVGDNDNLLVSFYDYYSNRHVRSATPSELATPTWSEHPEVFGRSSRNSDMVLRPTILVEGFDTSTLGAALLHEYTHTRHPRHFIGTLDYLEGEAYGIEYFFAERNSDTTRMEQILGIMQRPSTLVMGQTGIAALRERFSDYYGTIKVLYEIIDTGSSSFSSAAPLHGLDAAQARVLSTELIATPMDSHSARLTQIIDWVRAQRSDPSTTLVNPL